MNEGESRAALARYRMDKAWEAYDDACYASDNRRYDMAASRIYYAFYRACLALLSFEPILPKKHSTVIGMVNQKYVRTGKLPREFGHVVGNARELRDNAEYRLQPPSREDVEQLLEESKPILQAIQTLMEQLIDPGRSAKQ